MKLGQWGEERVVLDYESRGFRVVERNWRTRYGEIDIIVENDECLVFIEVKTRKSKKFGDGFEAVDELKQEKLTTTAELYLVSYPSSLSVRFDVVSVFAPRGVETKDPMIHRIEDAF